MAAKKKVMKNSVKKSVKSSAKKPVKKAVKKLVASVSKKKPAQQVAKKAARMPAKRAPAKAKAPLKRPAVAVKAAPAKDKMVSTKKWDQLISPLDDRLIVEPEKARETTAGGLFIPGNVSVRPSKGRVLAKGPGRRNKKGQIRPLDVSVGDQVMFAEWAGSKVQVDGVDILIMREEDILGIVI